MRTTFRAIRETTRAWWHFKSLRDQGRAREARAKEHQSARRTIATIREAIANDGFVIRSHQGNSVSLHVSVDSTVQNCHLDFEDFVRAGIGGIDYSTATSKEAVSMAWSGPILTPMMDEKQAKYRKPAASWDEAGPFSYLHWRKAVQPLRDAGITIHNDG